ncbi:MAG: hypothetical protein FJ368_02710 [Pelagibacterales bacterium]|nr:hypothetical protein [Pelagibacterales bacterium]
MKKMKIAIIGAGISGITIALELQKFAEVKIFEKSRGVGGRMSTRYNEDFAFDHGAQCFTARTKVFQKFLQPFIVSEDVLPWTGKAVNIDIDGKVSPRFWFETHLVAAPNMNSLCKKMAIGLDISTSVEVAPIVKKDDLWNLKDINGNDLGNFDFVISTAPQVQTKNLFGESFKIKEVSMQPCFALMLGFKEKWQFDWIFAKVRNNPIKLIALNSSKPKRNSEVTSLVIHSRSSWSKENLDNNLEEITQVLTDNLKKITGIDANKADYKSIHRWKYALVDEEKSEIFLDKNLKIAATSDWVTNSRIEDVWLMAKKLSESLIEK